MAELIAALLAVLATLGAPLPPDDPFPGRERGSESREAARGSERRPVDSEPSQGAWERLRACESSGDYGVVDATGVYRGAYQFDLPTWESVGGSGDPAEASPAEQDRRALLLWEQRGSDPWPVCGRYLEE